MLKHLVHSHPNKLHTFDDFYRTTSKPIKTRSLNSDGTSSTSSSSSPTSPCSPSNNSYTFYSIFSDFKSNSTSDPLPEEDETEVEQQTDGKCQQQEQLSIIDKPPSIPNTPLFYLDEDHHPHPLSPSQQATTSTSTHSPSSHWPSLLLNRFRHHPSSVAKQSSLNENQMSSTKLRKTELNDPITITRISSNRFLKRSDTLDPTSTDHFNEDFPELSSPTSRTMSCAKKHRSFVSVFQHFPHPHLSSTINSKSNSNSSSNSNKSNSTGTLDSEPIDHPQRPKLVKQKAISSPQEIVSSPVNKSPATPILPKLASLFQRHHHHHHHSSQLSEQYKYRVGNLKARLHHRRTSPSSTSTTKFQCPSSNDLIHQITNDEDKTFSVDYLIDSETIRQQRSTKPVIMKRVHTWHNSFNLTPIDQCVEY